MPVAVDVVEPPRLRRPRFGDLPDFPGSQTGTRMPNPEEKFTPIIGAEEVIPPVSVNIQNEIRIVVEPSPDDGHIAKEMAFPGGCLIPPAAGNDI